MSNVLPIEQVDKSIRERGWLRTMRLIILCSLPAIVVAVVGFLMIKDIKNQISSINNQVTTIYNIISPGGSENPVQNTDKTLGQQPFKEEKWNISELEPEKEDDQYTGYFCAPKNFSRGSYARMWYKEKIPARSTLNLTLILKDRTTGKNDNNLPPRLVYSFGSEKEQKLFVPGSDPRFIEFEDPNNKPPTNNRALDRVIDTSKQILLEIKMDYQTNDYYITIDPKITYFPVGEDKQTNPIVIEGIASNLSIINPDKTGSEQRFGFGVFKPDCFKPISFGIE